MAADRKGRKPAGAQEQVMHMNPRMEKDRESIVAARKKGKGALLGTFVRLSGPGWLQSGITLGGGSLSSSLYLGVLVGFSFMWLQPLAMILGIIMLSAIAYVTLSTGERPLRAINSHVNPVLGWGWLVASMMANLVWSLPQFALGTAAIQQNLLPWLVGADGLIPAPFGKMVTVCFFLGICITFTMLYGAGGRGVKVFETIIRIIVTMIVVCFFGVIVKLSLAGELDWGAIARGFIPDLGLLMRPTDDFLEPISHVVSGFQAFWSDLIVGQQRDVMISAAATAVGINMTFLLPYSMLRKGWNKDFRGLAIFDLSTGLFIPFILATSFVVIASASQFHATPAEGFVPAEEGGTVTVEPAKNLVGAYNRLLADRLKHELGADEFAKLTPAEVKLSADSLPYADKKMAAMLVKRDAFNLAETLAPLTGNKFAQYIFGMGVIGMAMSAATMLMTINGLCFCELIGKPPRGRPQRIGALMVAVGALGPFFWKEAAFYIAVPTSIFAMMLLPIAYMSFLLLMNQKSVLGEHVPKGGKRVVWNVLMGLATAGAGFGGIWSIWSKTESRFGSGWIGIAIVAVFILICVIVHILRANPQRK